MVIYTWGAVSIHLSVCLQWGVIRLATLPGWLEVCTGLMVEHVQGGFVYWLNILHGKDHTAPS